jgi:hypothetical protein
MTHGLLARKPYVNIISPKIFPFDVPWNHVIMLALYLTIFGQFAVIVDFLKARRFKFVYCLQKKKFAAAASMVIVTAAINWFPEVANPTVLGS